MKYSYVNTLPAIIHLEVSQGWSWKGNFQQEMWTCMSFQKPNEHGSGTAVHKHIFKMQSDFSSTKWELKNWQVTNECLNAVKGNAVFPQLNHYLLAVFTAAKSKKIALPLSTGHEHLVFKLSENHADLD